MPVNLCADGPSSLRSVVQSERSLDRRQKSLITVEGAAVRCDAGHQRDVRDDDEHVDIRRCANEDLAERGCLDGVVERAEPPGRDVSRACGVDTEAERRVDAIEGSNRQARSAQAGAVVGDGREDRSGTNEELAVTCLGGGLARGGE